MDIKSSVQLPRLEACRKVRQYASQTCLYTLQKILQMEDKVSEVKFRNIWLKAMFKSRDIISEGWYDPPPSGIGILFGNEQNLYRVNYPTLRIKKYWPQENIYFQKDGLGYIFASPFIFIDNLPIIGDFGFTYYLGSKQKIIDNFKKCRYVLNELFEMIKIGMEYRQLYDITVKFLNKNNLHNNITSITNIAGTDVGHCIPFIDRDPNKQENKKLKSNNLKLVHQVINKARRFINNKEDFLITENCAFTFEPRLTSLIKKTLPMFSLHVIVQFIEGKKIILKDFKGIFNLLGMNWLKN